MKSYVKLILNAVQAILLISALVLLPIAKSKNSDLGDQAGVIFEGFMTISVAFVIISTIFTIYLLVDGIIKLCNGNDQKLTNQWSQINLIISAVNFVMLLQAGLSINLGLPSSKIQVGIIPIDIDISKIIGADESQTMIKQHSYLVLSASGFAFLDFILKKL